MKCDYLKNTAFWQNWLPVPKPENKLDLEYKYKNKFIGRFYFIGWGIKKIENGDGANVEFVAFTYPILIDRVLTKQERIDIKNKKFKKAFSDFKKGINEKGFISFAPSTLIPEQYKNFISIHKPTI